MSDAVFHCQAFEHDACCGQPGELTLIALPGERSGPLVPLCSFHQLVLSSVGTRLKATETSSPNTDFLATAGQELLERFENDQTGCFMAVSRDMASLSTCANAAGEYSTGMQLGPLVMQLALCEAHHDFLEVVIGAITR